MEKKSETVTVAEPTLEKKSEPDKKVIESTAKDITPAPPETLPAQEVIASPLPTVKPQSEEIKPAETSESTAIEPPQPSPVPQQSVDPPVPQASIKPTEIKLIEPIEAEPEKPHLFPPEEAPIPPALAPKVDKKQSEKQRSEQPEKEPSPLQTEPTSFQDSATPPTPDVPINNSDPSTIPTSDIPKPETSPTPPSAPHIQAPPVPPPPVVAAHRQDVKISPNGGIHELLKSHTEPTNHKLAQMNIILHQAPVPVHHVQVTQHDEVLHVYTPTPVKIKPPAKTTEASLQEGYDIF